MSHQTKIIKALLYHYHSREARNKTNASYNHNFIVVLYSVFFLFKIFLLNILPKKKIKQKSISLLTSPYNHVASILKKFEKNIIYIGKGELFRFVNINLEFKDVIVSYYFSKKQKQVFTEVLSIFLEVKGAFNFLNKNNFETIYYSNLIDRYSFIINYDLKKFKVIFIPHGDIMIFPIKKKITTNTVILRNKLELKKIREYLCPSEVKFSEKLNSFNSFLTGKNNCIAYFSSSINHLSNIEFILKLVFQSKRKINVYPHPKEKKIIYYVLNLLGLIEIPTRKYNDYYFAFARHSTLSNEYYKLNKRMYYFNPENRDINSFPNNSKILDSVKSLDELQELL